MRSQETGLEIVVRIAVLVCGIAGGLIALSYAANFMLHARVLTALDLPNAPAPIWWLALIVTYALSYGAGAILGELSGSLLLLFLLGSIWLAQRIGRLARMAPADNAIDRTAILLKWIELWRRS